MKSGLVAWWLFMTVACVMALAPVGAQAAKPASANDDVLEAELRELDQLFANRHKNLKSRSNRIAAAADKARREPNTGNFMSLADLYTGFNNDSAIHYFNRAKEVSVGRADSDMVSMRLAALLPLAGFTDDAIHIFNAIDTTAFSADDYIDYYECGRNMYAAIADFFSSYPDVSAGWSAKVLDYQIKLMQSLANSPDTNRYRIVFGENNLRLGRHDIAETVLRDVYATENTDSKAYIRAAQLLASILEQRKDYNGQIHYLISAVSGELTGGIIDLRSLQPLGLALYHAGDDERAFRYLSTALDDATSSVTRVRMMQTAAALPMVQRSHVRKLENSQTKLYIVIIALVIALIAVVILMANARREYTRMKSLRLRLEDSNSTKEMYISQFLSLCSVFMDQLISLSGNVKRKIAAGRIDEVSRMLQSDKFIAMQSEQFFNVFDDAFLHIYPTFVDGVNAQLRPEHRIVLKDGERMNVGLRILAFMRMGITDSGRIAQMLNYSINTIYAYRNRMKSYAIDRDVFESRIMEIPSV